LPEPPSPRKDDAIAAAVTATEGCVAAGDWGGAAAALARIKPAIDRDVAFVRALPRLIPRSIDKDP
jgi:hypothetical protein